ncbi:transposase [uncultured Holdemanella sp.]|uniref:transposase n=1 Tax=uncultured Holdemanella sp. TaxID=1763549 RepID=UPI00338EA2F5
MNSFTRIKVYIKSARTEKEYYARLSNGPMESFNRKPKDLKRDFRGFSGFNYTRNRILTTRKNPSELCLMDSLFYYSTPIINE